MSSASNRRRATRAEPDGPPVERSGRVWRIRSVDAARQVLRARRATRQAGFTAEFVPKGFLKHHPILMSDGPLHDEQRSKVGRFFAPKVVAERYAGLMDAAASARIDALVGEFDLAEVALSYSVEVTAEVVGLTHSDVEKMARRLVTFFRQPPADLTRPDLGRSPRQWLQAAVNGLVPIVRFHLADVRPALRAHRRTPADDIIGHLIAQGYTNADILVECVTFGTAGMVTTREFIAMAAWHLLTDAALAGRFRDGTQAERLAILNEIIRLEPVVGHLYRRVTEPLEVTCPAETVTLAPGDLIDVCVRAANADPETVGPDPLALRPGRELPPGVDASVLTFGDGAHRCPGQPLALLEADALLTRLLARAPVVVREPTLGWDDLIEGYTLRDFVLRVG